MPELPEVQAHAERLTELFRGHVLEKFVPFNFTALKTAVPRPDEAYGKPLLEVGRRGKYLLLCFEPVVFVVHLMQGGRLLVDDKLALKPRNGQARFLFTDTPALLLTEAGKERQGRGVVHDRLTRHRRPSPAPSRPRSARAVSDEQFAERFAAHNMRIHGFMRDQHMVAGLGPNAGERGLSHRAQGLAVRDDGQARGSREPIRCARRSTRAWPTVWPTSAPAPT